MWGGRVSSADRGRGAVLASAVPAPSLQLKGGLFPVVALPEDSPLPDSNSVCQLPLQIRVSFHTGPVEPLQQGRPQASVTAEI